MNTKAKNYKEFIKLNRRIRAIDKELDKLPLIKLDTPYQKGWEISYDLRQDIKNRKDSAEILEIIEKGYFNSYTNNVKAVKAIRRGDKNSLIKIRHCNRHIRDFYPHGNYLIESDYKKLLPKLQKYYDFSESDDYYIKTGRKRYYCYFPSYWLVLRVKPYIITHRRQKGGELEREQDHIWNRLYYSGEFNNLVTNYGKSYPAHKDRVKVRDKISKFKSGKIEDIYNDKIPREYEY